MIILRKFLITILTIIFVLGIIKIKADSYEEFDGNYTYQSVGDGERSVINNFRYDEEVLFIVDFSGSMNSKMGFTPKIYLAIEAIRDILDESGKETRVGLRIFGVPSRTALMPTNRGMMVDKSVICTASRLVLPISRYNADSVSDSLSNINPQGGTPIGYSLREAVKNDFNEGSHLKHIILVTDGGENCGDNPCQFIRTLLENRNDYKIDVIGITVDSNDYSQLACIANAGRGKYLSVNSPEDFKTKFAEAFNSVPKHSVTRVNSQYSPINMHTPSIDTTRYKTYGFQFRN